MKILSDIQSQVRVYASDSTLVLTDNTDEKIQGLNISNRVYRKLCLISSWPELTIINEDIDTVAGQSNYDFNIKYGAIKYGEAKYGAIERFVNITSVEVENQSGDYVIIPQVKSELDWSFFSKKTNVMPSVYQKRSFNNSYSILLAPTPKFSSSLKIKGIIEPVFFTSGSSSTIFFSSIMDDALEYMIAAEILFSDGDERTALSLIKKASNLISGYLGKEIPPDEIDPRVQVLTDA
jgi:hypothetical protein